ncbi:MAG: response regulator [Alphaproteobacteria bacterium]|nr:response regulator [Alphaproteobacteria bacterium]
MQTDINSDPCSRGRIDGDAKSTGPAEDESSREAGVRSPACARVLVVEDGDTNRMIAQAMLQRAGYSVDCAYDGAEAVTMVLTGDYAAVFMDLAMPVMDGVEATLSIRQLPAPMSKTPIVALTAHDSHRDRMRCAEAGMDDYLPKPLRYDRLLETLSRLVKERDGAIGADSSPQDSYAESACEANGGAAPIVSNDILAQLERDAGLAALRRLIAEFLSEAREIADALAAPETDDYDDRARLSHSLKSSAAAFGATALADAAAQLETAYRVRALDSAQQVAGGLTVLVQKTGAALTERKLIG